MHQQHWKIDESLGLVGADERVLHEYQTLGTLEQSIDTILHRNLATITTALFGCPGRFLFHSSDYWGEFDVCCALSDRRLVAFENKGRQIDKNGFAKFCKDTQTISIRGHEHVSMRYRHVLEYYPRYMKLAERMFAAFFLGIRCDTAKDTRDLMAEAAKLLSVEPAVLHDRLHARNDWLVALSSKPELTTYLSDNFDDQAFNPILLVPENRVAKVQTWAAELKSPVGVTAHLAGYRFGSRDKPFPEVLSIRYVGTFAV